MHALTILQRSIAPLLTGIHHARIVYPGQKDREPDKGVDRRVERKART